MEKLLGFYFLSVLLVAQACAQNKDGKIRKVGGGCDGCEAMFEGMPASVSWETTLAPINEPGEPLIISGTIYQRDGKTLAPDILLYVYHTDNKGLYSPASNQTTGTRHGHLRGWIKTDSQGRYQFSSIRPASYPNGKAPQHIHPLIKEPTTSLYWIDEYLFDDDPFLTHEERLKQQKRGGSGIIQLTKNEKGVWIGRRDIILGMNVPDY